jgi:Protein of unknown function (DUF2442)
MPVTVLPAIVRAAPLIHGVLKIEWDDGCAGIVDLRPVISRARSFTYLQRSENFNKVRVASYGHSIYWGEEGSELVDFGCDRLREMAEEQSARARPSSVSAEE